MENHCNANFNPLHGFHFNSLSFNSVYLTMGDSTMIKNYHVILISILAGIFAVILTQLILPGITSGLSQILDNVALVTAANVISWGAIIITAIFLLIVLLFLLKEFNLIPLLLLWGIIVFFSSLFLILLSFCVLYSHFPNVFGNSTVWERIIKSYTYPTLVSLSIQTPEPVWWVSSGLMIGLFNAGYYYLIKKGE